MATNNTTICPECGATNDSGDLFCKDCGGSLAAVDASSQQTSTFQPVSVAQDTQTTFIAPAAAPQSAPEVAYVPTPAAGYAYATPLESARGAVLGWLAATLILIIVGAFVWSSIMSDAARDRITGIF